MKLKLTCSCCGSSEPNRIKLYSEFDIFGYDSSIEWSDEEHIPFQEKLDIWMRSDFVPQVGERRAIRVQYPFNETKNTNFWSFYTPALSSLNGIDYCIEEFERYAFVRSELVDILSNDNSQSWVRVLVKEIILVKDAMILIPTQYEKSLFLKKSYDFSPYYYKSFGDWEYYIGSDQSDLGNWFLIYKTLSNVHLISFGEWNFHQDSSYLGNLVISPATYRTLVAERKLSE